ncbi:mannosyltransferase [Sistotremastrum suecicum HHB10207 ss-3]|uniref:GPI mannosyltransferase 2 n=1 Tax=Sistotremastrum suecicum HHB10207 ss-3 TaxID=1314776 RepID=A0A166IEA5_9AGAM|nr:mannosyltransferase [Sistotremastrum suecicum HHB10207 ss-3]
MTASHELRLITLYAICARLFFITLIVSASLLPPFDSSHKTILPAANPRSLFDVFVGSLLRWDEFYFADASRNGYQYEHEWAFFPGPSWARRLVRSVWSIGGRRTISSLSEALFTGALTNCFTVWSARILYLLSVECTGSASVARISALLSLLPSSPAVIFHVGYTEPLFNLCSYMGMLKCVNAKWAQASFYFMLANSFRSNGVLLAGFVLWGLIADPFLRKQKIPLLNFLKSILYVAITIAPFVYHQFTAWVTFCQDDGLSVEWCKRFPPLIYSHVQATYWNVGFLRYWTPSQIPNFLICSPPLLLLFWSSTDVISRLFRSHTQSGLAKQASMVLPHMVPHAIHAIVLTSWILVAAHTQIILRLASSMPFLYWSAARLILEQPKLGAWWVGWSVTWGCISSILWAVFLPPA